MPETQRVHHCPVVNALLDHLIELREREVRLARMIEEHKTARRVSVKASLEGRLQIVSQEISELDNLLKVAGTAPNIPPYPPTPYSPPWKPGVY